jgi:lariat debranching enzyme
VTPSSPDCPVVFAAVGDVHGRHHAMVELVGAAAERAGVEVSFVLQVGDFEPHRHAEDLATMAAPARHRQLGDFGDFHDGRSLFPWPVLFVGGNHEPYGFLDTLGPGAEVAPSCRYLGRAGVVELGGLRVAGLSGIFRPDQFESCRPHVSLFPTTGNKRFIGYTRDEIGRLLDACDAGPPDVLLLHEWPRLELGADEIRQINRFVSRQSPFAGPEEEADLPDFHRFRGGGGIGSEAALELVQLLEPSLVLCGHMHVPLRSTLPGGPNQIPMRALAKVEFGAASVALFRVRPGGGGFEELEP